MQNIGWKELRRQKERDELKEEFSKVLVMIIFSAAVIAAMVWSMPKG